MHFHCIQASFIGMTIIEGLLWLTVTTILVGRSQNLNSSAILPLFSSSEDDEAVKTPDGQVDLFLTLPLTKSLLRSISPRDDIDIKRQFDPWGGKRRHLSYKRMSNRKRQFSPWGGKRGVIYKVGTEKADSVDPNPLLLSRKDVNQRDLSSNDTMPRSRMNLDALTRKRNFNSWGGKRSFNSWGGKRDFNSWGGKRNFNSWGGKRNFNSWGGKRSGDAKGKFVALEDEIYSVTAGTYKPVDPQWFDSITMKYFAKANEKNSISTMGV